MQPTTLPNPRCNGCKREPAEIAEYCDPEVIEGFPDPASYVRSEEGTYNPKNGHFLCTECYIRAGQPSSPAGWKAP